jgi:hypothetical protein
MIYAMTKYESAKDAKWTFLSARRGFQEVAA